MQCFACFPLQLLPVVSDTKSLLVHWEFIHTAQRMSLDYVPFLEIFLGLLGFGLSIMFCTAFCRACSRIREAQIEREAWRYAEREGHQPPSIYVIPFPGNISQHDGEDPHRVPRYSQEVHSPPQYSTSAYCGPPPSYTELEIKPEDLPPAYTEYSVPVYPITPPPDSDIDQPQTQTQTQT